MARLVSEEYSVAATSTTPANILSAYREHDEEFYGPVPDELHRSHDLPELNSDEEELGSEPEDETAWCTFNATEDNDEVSILDQDFERKAVEDKIQNGCGCSSDCFRQFSVDELFSIRLQMRELEKTEREMLLLGKLQVLARGTDSVSHARRVTQAKRQRVTFQYAYDHRLVCKSAFCFLHTIGEKAMKNIQKHLKDIGATPRDHGNKGQLPHNAFTFDTVQNIVGFITNYATIHDLPQPAARRGRAAAAPLYLPASEGYNTVHQKYVTACVATGKTAAKYHAFRQIWLQCIPHIQFMTPRTDVCHYCENFRVLIPKALSEEDKLSLAHKFQKHVDEAQKEREYYLASIRKSEENLQSSLGSTIRYCHYTFDFAQQLQVPYHARQVGPLYFKSPLKVQLFCICNDANKMQVNYLFDESQSIGPNGTKAHGPNAVISMLHHYFEVHALHESSCHLHADNCVGQNKNRFVIGYLTWRVLTGQNESISLSFMRVGHTRCMVDGNFGLIKRVYRHSDVDTVPQLNQVVIRSSEKNIPQPYTWEWREWDDMLGKLFTPIKGIRVSADMGGKIALKTCCDGEETFRSILKRGVTVQSVRSAPLPRVLKPAGLTRDRQHYLYTNIREHVWPEYQAVTCPPPQ